VNKRDRQFESPSLQQRVSLSAASAFEGREPRLSARVCGWFGDAVGRDAQGFPIRPNLRQYLCRAIFQYRSAADVVGEDPTPIPTKSIILDTLNGLEMAYPEVSAERRQELQSIRERLIKGDLD
jgi:hypothetical protein